MSDRFTILVAQAICDADGPDGPSYGHLATAAIRVIEQEFEVFRVENDRLRAENEKLRAALKPFADAAEIYNRTLVLGPDIDHWVYDGERITFGDLRAAAAALKETDNA